MQLDNALVLGLLAVLIGGGGLAGLFYGRHQASKFQAEAAKVGVEAGVIEARVSPEIDALVVETLGKAATTLASENERMARRLAAADAVVEQQTRTIAEQASTINGLSNQ